MNKKKLLVALTLVVTMAFGGALTVSANVTNVSGGQPGYAPHADNVVDATNNRITFTTPTDVPPTDPVDPEDPIYPIDPDPDQPPTDNRGAIRIDVVPNFNFGSHQVQNAVGRHTLATLPQHVEDGTARNVPHFVQVGDWRGTGLGWELTATLQSQFAGSAVAADVLTGATIDLFNIGALTANNVAPVPAAGSTIGELTGVTRLALNTPQNIATAAEGQGIGTTAVRFGDVVLDETGPAMTSVVLDIPEQTVLAQTYTATVRWTLIPVNPAITP